ncbi:hypothetical protein BGW38_000366, partial [Lunasporangiospora selenospora]
FERETGKPRGYGFCEFHDERTAASAVRNLNGREIGNRSLKVDFAETDPARNGGRDLDDGPFVGPTGQGFGQGSQPMRSAGPQNMPQPHHLHHQIPQGLQRIDPRLANSVNNNMPPLPPPVPMVPRPPLPQQHQSGGVTADSISAVLGTMTPLNLFELFTSMKVLGASEPERARAVLSPNPRLAYALFQVLLMMNVVEPSSLKRVFPGIPGNQQPSSNVPITHTLPPQLPPQPSPALHMGMAPLPPHMQPPLFAPQPFPGMAHPLQPPQQPGLTPPGPSIGQQNELVARVLALTPAEIASLPAEQQAHIMQLKAQLMGAN